MKKSQRSSLRLLAATTLVLIAGAGTAVTAQAAFIVNATETGGNVVFEGAGSIDTSAWTLFGTAGDTSPQVNAASALLLGPRQEAIRWFPGLNRAGPDNIGPGTTTKGMVGQGDYVGMSWTGGGAQTVLWLAQDYVSGAVMSSSATASSSTFASLGITPGSYVWTWGTGATADSFTLNVGAVPVPAAAWLFGSGLLGLIGVARRKKVS
jgi:hypothetical protein